jgi:hypothetical protein
MRVEVAPTIRGGVPSPPGTPHPHPFRREFDATLLTADATTASAAIPV